MTDVYRDGAFRPDDRPILADDAALPEGPFFVSEARFLAERERLSNRLADLGVVLDPALRIEPIADDLARLAAIAIPFAKFGDGRGYSLARLVREKHGFAGELRAIGDILWDQIEALGRVGFDTLVIAHQPTRDRLARGLVPALPVRYQPVGAETASGVPGRRWLGLR